MRCRRRIAGILLAALASPGLAATLTPMVVPANPGSMAPSLHRAADNRIYASWIEPEADGHRLRFAVFDGQRFSPARTVARGGNWFVNWADVPSLVELPDGTLAAHWLVRNGGSKYAYEVRLARSRDGGDTWQPDVRLHRDDSASEHGFVSLVPLADGELFAAWLDGASSAKSGAMMLRATTVAADGGMAEERVLDKRVCDCCRVAAVAHGDRVLVAFRDRSEKEIRDHVLISLPDRVRMPLGGEGWKIEACPVNGPALVERDRRVLAAWYSAAGGMPVVRARWIEPASAALQLNAGQALGRVDAVLLPDGSGVVTWLELDGAQAVLRARRLWADKRPGPVQDLLRTGAERASGFPRIAAIGAESLLVVWTDAQAGRKQLQAARVTLDP
ncbi:MAG: glycoside hydrolase [Gammaproteobacteria bacterium]|nr:glycoside hydrolase [Gammaproteobacteria bacterium]